jgi:hypothetical protein
MAATFSRKPEKGFPHAAAFSARALMTTAARPLSRLRERVGVRVSLSA